MIDTIEFSNDGRGCVGEEYPITDGQDPDAPKRSPVGEKALIWLTRDYDADYPLRILARQGTLQDLLVKADASSLVAPFSEPITKDILKSSVGQYQALLQAQSSGGSFCHPTPTLNPSVFVVQTPYDDGPFCSMALMTWGQGSVRGIYFYTDETYGLSRVLKDSTLYSGWRSSGFHIVVLPLAFLGAHVAQVSRDIQRLSRQISSVENLIAVRCRPDDSGTDLSMLTRNLYECSTALSKLEQRVVFNLGLVSSIEQYFLAAEKGRSSTTTGFVKGTLEAHKNMIESHRHDIKALPRRIETQQTMVFYLTVHRDSYVNLQISEASRRIAEASMKDSASMKTIAILTMLFLPGTAVASFFSMTMFDWNPQAGEPLASSYIWIYFVVAIPLTLFVILVWYVRTQSHLHGERFLRKTHAANNVKPQYVSTEQPPDVEMTTLNGSTSSHDERNVARRFTAT